MKIQRRKSFSRRQHELGERSRRQPDPRCECGHRRSEHHPSPYHDDPRRLWCVADAGEGRVDCPCLDFRLPDDDAAAWLANRLARWAVR